MSADLPHNQTNTPSGKLPLPVIFGCERTELSLSERTFFENTKPFGFILFKRNCASPDQVKRLIAEMRAAVGRPDAPVLIDQEGGRVARLSPPNWAAYPPMRMFGMIYEQDPELGTEAMEIYSRLVSNQLAALGITVNCAPVVDLFIEGASPAIGDRAFSSRPSIVAALARRCAEVMLENGVLPVIKHLPGHGRVKLDPHVKLPVIDASRMELESEDFVPFELLKDLPIGMNSHAVFQALDRDTPASLSPVIYQDVIRGRLGFDGLILSDDICMKALHGFAADIACNVLQAGADVVLHCNGILEEMLTIAARLDPMAAESWARWQHAQSMAKEADPYYNAGEDIDRLDMLLGALAFDLKSAG